MKEEITLYQLVDEKGELIEEPQITAYEAWRLYLADKVGASAPQHWREKALTNAFEKGYKIIPVTYVLAK